MTIERIEDLRLLAAPSPPREEGGGMPGRNRPACAAARPAAGAGTGGPIPRDGEPTGPRPICDLTHQRSRRPRRGYNPRGRMAVEEAGRSDGDSIPRGAVGRGQLVAGRVVKLLSLRAPRGRITPAALCAFLEAVNGCEVEVAR
jgi:hypothetical protein